MLEIKNLNVNIHDKAILKGLDLTINEGEIHAIMGVNGAGKSTLVKTLSNHYDCEVTSGKIDYKDKNLLEMDVETRANEGLYLSYQSPVEVAGVNNSYFLKSAINAKREYQGLEPLDAVAFMKLIREKTAPFNLDTKLLQRDLNYGFSGGEKKRNELLQLLLLEPELIMLDEIDSGLDIDAIKTVSEVIKSMLNGKRSLLMITHYDRLLELIRPDFVHILKDGKIIKTGDYKLAQELDEKGFDGLGL